MAKDYDRYDANQETGVDTDGIIIDPDFTIHEFVIVNRQTDADLEFRTLGTPAQSISGPWIRVIQAASGQRTPFERKFKLTCSRIEVRAASGTVDFDWITLA